MSELIEQVKQTLINKSQFHTFLNNKFDMKQIGTLGLLLLMVTTACTEDKLMLYSGTDNIYFEQIINKKREVFDSLMFSFEPYTLSLQDTILKIPVSITGQVKEYDREFAYSVAKESTAEEGKHFEVGKGIVPAGESVGYLSIKAIRHADLADPDKPDTAWSVKIKLESNKNFNTDFYHSKELLTDSIFQDRLHFSLYITDNAVKPSGWIPFIDNILGTYSKVKMDLIITFFNVTREDFIDIPKIQDIIPWANYLRAYLEDYKKQHGKPLLDENENEVKIGL